MKKLLFILLLIPQLCFAQTTVSNRDIKQLSQTKLFISGNHLVPDFSDVSTNNHAITKYADAKTVNEKSTTNPKYFPVGNDKAIYMDGTTDYISTTRLDSGDYTKTTSVELWYYPKTVTGTIALVQSGQAKNGAFLLSTNDAGLRIYKWTTDGVTTSYIGAVSSVLTINTWHHIVVEWEAGTTTSGNVNYYINGNKTAVSKTLTSRDTAQFTTSYIGYCSGSGYSALNGFVRNVQVSEGIARYSASFTAPNISTYTPPAPDAYTLLYVKGYDLAVNAVSFTDESGTGKVLTTNGDTKVGYSRGVCSYFDGTGDYLTLPVVGNSDYTTTASIELWFYPVSLSGYKALFNNASAVNGSVYLGTNNGTIGLTRWTTTGTNVYYAYSDTVLPSANKWYHIIVEYEAGTTNTGNINYWVNGVKTSKSKSNTTASGSGNQIAYIGIWGTNYPVNGYIYGLKYREAYITPYATSFTPSETEPTVDAYTKLLLKTKMQSITDIATAKAVTLNGQTGVSQDKYKTGKYSIGFDGSGDYLSLADHADWSLGSAEFTIDFWYRTNVAIAAGDYDAILGQWAGTGNQRSYSTYLDESERIVFSYTTDGINPVNMVTTAISTNTWYHVAIVRVGNDITLYLNGVAKETDTGVGTLFASSSSFYVGIFEAWAATNYINGYVSDIRLTKKALWTTNFTPPKRSGAF